MNPPTLRERLKEWIAGIAFSVFLWGIRMSADQYRLAIYEQEKRYHEEENENR